MILLVEDNQVIATATQRFLELSGFAVEVASTGREAIQRLQSGAVPSLVLLDLVLPEGDGNAVLDTLQTLPSPPPVVVVSAFVGDLREDLRRVPRLVLEKPVGAERILEAVRQHQTWKESRS